MAIVVANHIGPLAQWLEQRTQVLRPLSGEVRIMNFCMAVKAKKQAFLGFSYELFPRSV